jgi:hypothetical protein
MVNSRVVTRLGMLAVGLGVGAAVAHTPVASADSSTDLVSWLGGLDPLAAASTPSTSPDLAISFDGISLVHDGNATAATTPGDFGLAIASGDGATANAVGGTGDYALADGTNALANAGDSAPGATGANFDSAIDIGNNDPTTGGAYAGASDLIGGTDGGTGSYDTAIDIGNITNDTPLGIGSYDGAFAGAGGLVGLSGNGDHDTAINFGNLEGTENGPAAVGGDFDTATASGNEVGNGLGAFAGLGNGDLASMVGGTGEADAGGQFGTDLLGNYDISTVFDTGTFSYADAGASATDPGNFDLAGAFGPDLSSTMATGGNYLVDIMPSLGEGAATGGGNLLADLLSLF